MSDKDTIYRQDAIEVLDGGAELLRRVLDDLDIVGAERRKYKWGLGLFESCISDMKELPPAEPPSKFFAKIMINKEDIEELAGENVEKIKEMLKSQSERKKGKWIEIKYTFHHKCSNCEWINNADSGYNFCPNCGADMRGEQNDTD